MFGRDKIAKIVVEFLGTAMLASAVLSMARITGFAYFPAAAAGLTVGLLVLLIGGISGAHVNPAVTIGQWTLRQISTLTAVVYVCAQMLGGLAAWKLNEWLLDSPLKSIAGPKFSGRVLVAEIIGTFIFGLGVAVAVKKGYKGLKAAGTIGTALFIGILVASLASNGVLNPAVAVGIQSWDWAYAVGPIIGAILGMNLYILLTEPFIPARTTSSVKVSATTAKTKKAAPKKKPAAKKRK